MNDFFSIKKIVILVSILALFILCFTNFNYNDLNQAIPAMKNKKEEVKYVYPFGMIIGVKANTDGVLVIGYEEDDVEYIGGIKKGDNIIEINDQKVSSSHDVSSILKNIKSNKVKIKFERDNKYKTEYIKIKNENGTAKLGLWVREKISGIGTITYYDPSNLKFKAVGHAITDADTNEFLKISQGDIYELSNIKINKGSKSNVGQIKGDIITSTPIGEFRNNSNYGISGNMTGKINTDVQLIEVGKKQDIKLGNAHILFEDKDRNITSYDVKIKSFVNDKKNDRNMIIEIIDVDLINYTGGIVQGMSGAPIIQNNKIIGALTHVFKNNPKKGYGIFIDEMIELDKRY
ncbi:SpoIVB peptidase S55 domain-containing protein [Romboutsia lituseburensis]|uniref:SpoIVB peptidase S55 domain-containing protein n=1 Tax=Romboutsia lituseburensis TaxID=1537 RepID=UPI00215AF4F9|nr:SpoIVB peptidase S55 domain-containing protein [Romboutsia lituseburensis]MCR8745242.1 peptidase S55 [Romboutsia lituseburensis]